MKKFAFIFVLFFAFVHNPIIAQNGYKIEVEVKDFSNDQLFLAYRRADKTYSADTATIKDGTFVFEGDEPLGTGIYLILLPPANKYFEFIVAPEEQQFSMQTDTIDLFKNLTFKNAPQNQLFFDYRTFMGTKIPASNALREQLEKETDSNKKAKLQKELDALIVDVEKKQEGIWKKNEQNFAGKLIKSWIEVPIPDVPEGEDEREFQFKFYRQHFWDNWDWNEPGFVLTPYLQQKIDQYLDRLTVQSPDSLKIAADYIIQNQLENKDAFRYSLTYILNKFYKPKILGLDEVYVHLAYKYYCGATPLADWVTDDVKKKICDDAFMIRGVLIGNKAPNVSTQLYSYEKEEWTDEKMALYDVDADYTIVFLWKPGCPACKKMTEEMKAFYAEYKEKRVEVFAISSATAKDLEKAKKDIQTKKTTWITTADPYLKARALQKFYGTSLPKIYLLDKDKKIIASRIGTDQLRQIIEKEMEGK